MTLEFVNNYIDKKLSENEKFIRYTYYELRVRNNLSKDDVDEFLRLNKIYFENKNYNVYFTNAEYYYKGTTKIVEPNELMIAIKEC